MDLEPVAVDLDPGLSNPIVAVTLAICCIAFAAWLVLVARSRMPTGRKARRLVVAFVVGSLASNAVPQMVNGLGTWAYTRLKGQHPSIGVIGNSPGLWLAPAIAVALALVVVGMTEFVRRARVP